MLHQLLPLPYSDCPTKFTILHQFQTNHLTSFQCTFRSLQLTGHQSMHLHTLHIFHEIVIHHKPAYTWNFILPADNDLEYSLLYWLFLDTQSQHSQLYKLKQMHVLDIIYVHAWTVMFRPPHTHTKTNGNYW